MPKTLGLALGSGADRGFAHIGVLKTLAAANISIDYLSGASMGAVIAAHYALHRDLSKLENLAFEIANHPIWTLADINNPSISLIKGDKIRQYLIDKLYGQATFADCSLPLAIVATKLEDGNAYLFKSGPLVDAIMASSSIPAILPPVLKDNYHLIDGGLADAVPLDVLDDFGADVRIGVDLYSYTPVSEVDFKISEVIARTYRLYVSKLSAANLYHNDPRTVIIRPQTDEGWETLTFSHAAENIQAGEKVTLTNLSAIKQMLG